MGNIGGRALLTDLYELTMLQAYFLQDMNETAVFEFFVRKLPGERGFLLAAGLEQVVSWLKDLRFDDEDIAWLRESGRFDPRFIDSLRDFRFTGDVDAMPEGTVFFADEPILRVTAPLREAQFIESRVINLLHYQTLVASKAVRAVMAAQGKNLVDFGLRRAHGAEAALLSARASYIAGFSGTATTAAGAMFGIPVSGTMAHSFVQAFASETEAFSAFAHAFPGNATLLIDTYDTEAAAGRVVRLAHWLRKEENIGIKAVRIDSGDLVEMSKKVRQILDAGGCADIGIFASGNLDEYEVQSLMACSAPIDGFGVGTRMNTSSDAPYLDCAYKLVEYAGRPCRKRSPGKALWPGCKQVFRSHDTHGVMMGDTLAAQHENLPGQTLLQPVVWGSMRVDPDPSLQDIRTHVRKQIAALPPGLRSLSVTETYPVTVSQSLHALAEQVDAQQLRQAESERVHLGDNVE